MAAVSRKSIVLARAVHAGELLATSDLRLMRPGTGIPASAIPTSRADARTEAEIRALHEPKPAHRLVTATEPDPNEPGVEVMCVRAPSL